MRISLQFPGQPRFILSFKPSDFLTLKAFIAYLCTQLGLQESDQFMHGKPKYLLMEDDAIVLTMESVHDDARLTLVQASDL